MSVLQREIQKLVTKEMNRKEFLAHIGAGALTVVGVSGLIKHLVSFNGSVRSTPQVSAGYGTSSYGGHKKS